MHGGPLAWSYNKSVASPFSEIHSAYGPPDGYGAGAGLGTLGGYDVGGILMDADPEGIATIQYAKEIDCDTDFEGTPITLPLNLLFDPTNPYTFDLLTYPSSVSIELSP
jgi:hypothetical protein